MLNLFGIRNCDTMKKARVWLDAAGVAYAFHDYKVAGVDRQQLQRWSRACGWEKVLNRAGTTFRKLPAKVRDSVDEAQAIELMLQQPSLIKRPVLEGDGVLLLGFRPEAYAAALRPAATR